MAALRTDILLDGYGVTECLRWHDDALWFVDMAGGGVHRWTQERGAEHVLDVPGRPGGLGWLPDGRLLVVSMDGHVVYRREADGSLAVHADLDYLCGGNANDMMVDAQGRAYVGNFGFDYHAFHREHANAMIYAPPLPPSARVVCLAPDGSIAGLGPEMLFPNGTVALPGGTVVVAETLRMRLTECDVDDDGVLINARPWADTIPAWMWRAVNLAGPVGSVVRNVSAALDRPAIAKHSSSPMAPDGIALHHDGETIWIGNALRGECARIAKGGKVVQRVRTSQHTLDCVLGGPDGRTLFAATTVSDDPTIGGPAGRGRIEAVHL